MYNFGRKSNILAEYELFYRMFLYLLIRCRI